MSLSLSLLKSDFKSASKFEIDELWFVILTISIGFDSDPPLPSSPPVVAVGTIVKTSGFGSFGGGVDGEVEIDGGVMVRWWRLMVVEVEMAVVEIDGLDGGGGGDGVACFVDEDVCGLDIAMSDFR
ncbi:hypothetical protein HanXRQr2_Chr09g0404851 [Helianthus annuus]|uniref:Uncharacterized protein n=1 Tax=Helianthus annuus TaxID=4232 RepID=A0A9K3N9V5_HELAN|nr:hypothetical protein HanXRQr2_Chr09g0404851 [Helianthus annuus]